MSDEAFDIMFNSVGIGIGIMGTVLLAIVIGTIVQMLKTYRKNNKSPRLTVHATLVSKREEISRSILNDNTDSSFHNDISTYYYATFQFESGDRMEFNMPVYEYGLLIEGDTGKLTLQGTRFISFERN